MQETFNVNLSLNAHLYRLRTFLIYTFTSNLAVSLFLKEQAPLFIDYYYSESDLTAKVSRIIL